MKTRAPIIVGIESKIENLAASSLLKPKNNAPVIAVPDLDAPEIALKICQIPIPTACRIVISLLDFVLLPTMVLKYKSAAKIKLDIAIV